MTTHTATADLARTKAKAEWKARHISPANAMLTRIIHAARELRERIDAFLDDHGDECPCGLCSGKYSGQSAETLGEVVEEDLTGMRWALVQGLACLECNAVELDADELAEAEAADADAAAIVAA